MVSSEEKRIIKEWSEYKQFKDPVYGYIPVSRPYVQYLIDTQMMQRIKGVAQTGLRPVFSSATHDRFSHSLGVFKFGMEMYDSFADKLRSDAESLFEKWGIESNLKDELGKSLKHWKTLLSIACLLHDIGHPVQSHGFEFLYDDPYLDIEYNQEEESLIIGDVDDARFAVEQARVFALLKEIKKDGAKTPEGNLRKALLKAFQDHNDPVTGTIPGAPHERMSAYYILNDKELIVNVKTLIRASREMASLSLGNSKEIDQDICFIARMIIGLEYPAEEQLSFQKNAFFNSVKNCVIHILNGKIDADGIDYLMRNSYTAGYDTSKIDSARLCKAFTSYEKNYIILPAFSKSALSVLEGYMSARNFEPKWLYSHHKVVYADLLTKRLYKYITRYLTDQTMLLRSVKLFLTHAEKSALVFNGDQDFGSDLMLIPNKERLRLNAKEWLSHMEQWSYPFYTYLLAPCRRYCICSHHFSKTADADMDALIHWMSNELAQFKNETDPQKRYTEYSNYLKKHVIESLDNLYLEENIKALRILLAESCLERLKEHDEDLDNILKAWIESGCTDTALNDLEEWKGYSADKETVQAFMRGLSGNDGKALLQKWLDLYRPLLGIDDFTEFFSLLDEFETRSYRKSLWKSYPEYRLFIKDCAEQLGYSFADVDRYMVKLIEEGMREHGFSIFEGKAVKNPPELYREQFFYQQYKPEERGKLSRYAGAAGYRDTGSTVQKKDLGKLIAQKWAADIFNEKNYDFSRTKLVVTFYRIKSKKFDGIPLLFSNRPVPLEKVLSTNTGSENVFPYFYIIEDKECSDTERILNAFKKDFIKYCREYRESEVRCETVKVGKNQIFRDSVYGDIEMPAEFYAVVCTREFQRLGRIRQLATADRAFPNATHTRLAHSIGTWHVMRLILQHFKHLYQTNIQLGFTEEEENIALLAALLHDLGHGPYSHVIENAFDKEHFHEMMTRKIIQDGNTEISTVIKEKFGDQAAERVCKLLDDNPAPDDSGISVIYHTLISGQLDADRIDYLMRDNVACGMSFGHIDIQQLITSMRMLPEYNNSGNPVDYRLCFDDRYLTAIDQFIYARYQMYKNVYYAPQKMLFEQIIKRIFLQADNLQDAIQKGPVFSTLMQIKKGSPIDVSEYVALDDESMNGLIKKWAAGDILIDEASASEEARTRKEILQTLSQAFLNHQHLYERVDLGGKQPQYDLLAKRISKQLNYDFNTFTSFDEKYSAFIFVQGEVYAYKKHKGKDAEKKNITLRNLDDGTTCDYIYQSMFLPAGEGTKETLMKTDYCYLFFSKEMLKKDCSLHGTSSVQEKVCQMVESAKPRKHIEIEKKFYCSKDQLDVAIDYLAKKYPNASRDEKDQSDTYFDCIVDGEKILFSEKFGFRCRKKGNQFIFTLKTPVDSPNYDSASEFARHEYELPSTDSHISESVYEFLTDTITGFGKKELKGQLERNKMQKLLTVCNHRVTYRPEGQCDCEICLDRVKYKTPDDRLIDPEIYQIEIELLDEPEKWTLLEKNVIDPLVAELGASLSITTESKLEKGLKLLDMMSH